MTTFEGTTLKIGDKDYVVPALTIKQIRTLKSDIQELRQLKDAVNIEDEKLDKMISVIYAAISRNYPDITREELENNLDMNNIQDVILIILGASGIVEKKNREKTQNP